MSIFFSKCNFISTWFRVSDKLVGKWKRQQINLLALWSATLDFTLSVKTHLNSKGFKNVTLAHWAGSVLQQPRLYARFMEEMTANTNTPYSNIKTGKIQIYSENSDWGRMEWNERQTYLHVRTESTSPGLYNSIHTAQASASGPVSCKTNTRMHKSSKHCSNWRFFSYPADFKSTNKNINITKYIKPKNKIKTHIQRKKQI